MKMLGLVGGTSWISTAEYYRLINQQVNARLGGAQYAKCIVYSFNHADIQAINALRDWDALLDVVTEASGHLRAAGAQGLVLCANTMHQIADRLQDRVDLPLIHIADATAAEIRLANIDTVALLGTRFTMEMDFYKERLARHGVSAIVPSPDDRDFIQRRFSTSSRARFFATTPARATSPSSHRSSSRAPWASSWAARRFRCWSSNRIARSQCSTRRPSTPPPPSTSR